MTKEEFIKVLNNLNYNYGRLEGKITIEGCGYHTIASLNSLTSIPPGVVFKNLGDVQLNSLTSLPPGTEFRNEGDVELKSLTSLPPDVLFENKGAVYLGSLTSLPPGVEFRNRRDVVLKSLLSSVPPVVFAGVGSFYHWAGNIKGIDSKRLLNKMISIGIFNRRR